MGGGISQLNRAIALAVALALVGAPALAGSLSGNLSGRGGLTVGSGSGTLMLQGTNTSAGAPPPGPTAGATSDPASAPANGGGVISPPGTNPFPSVSADVAPEAAHSSGQNWGQPLGADIYDSDTVHARLNYYYNNDQTSPQQGVGFSLTFPN